MELNFDNQQGSLSDLENKMLNCGLSLSLAFGLKLLLSW